METFQALLAKKVAEAPMLRPDEQKDAVDLITARLLSGITAPVAVSRSADRAWNCLNDFFEGRLSGHLRGS